MHRSGIVLLALILLVGGILASCGGSAKDIAELHAEQDAKLADEGLYDAAIREYDEAIRLNPQLC